MTLVQPGPLFKLKSDLLKWVVTPTLPENPSGLSREDKT